MTGDFDRLWEQHAGPLLAFLAYRVGNHHDAEDLLAETFERAMRKRRLFDRRRGSEKTWLYSIALNALRDRARRAATRERAHERLARPVSDGRNAIALVVEREALRRALAGLSTEEREVVALRFGADLTLEEIAAVTGEKQTTVNGRLYRALRKLKERLED